MKLSIKVGMLLSSLIFIFSCGNPDQVKNEPVQDTIALAKNDLPVAGVKLKDDKLNAVYQHYIDLTNALINEEVTAAKIACNAIQVGAEQVAGGAALSAAAAKIINAPDIEAQRTAYATLSNEFITLAKKSGLESGQLYIDFCPMAMNDKGAFWISPDKEIINPYFGEKMKTCGEIKDSIK